MVNTKENMFGNMGRRASILTNSIIHIDEDKKTTVKRNKATEKCLEAVTKTAKLGLKRFENLDDALQDEDTTYFKDFGKAMAKNMKELTASVNFHKGLGSEKKQSPLYKIPFINMFYDMFFDSVPTQDELTNLLEQIGVLSALLLTVAMAIPMSISFEEIYAARERFSITPYNASVPFEQAYRELFQCTAIATYSFAIAVTLTVMIYASSASGLETNFGDPDDNENSQRDFGRELRRIWWTKMRYVVLLCTLSSLIGCASLTIAYNRLCYFKFIDFFVEKEKKAFGIMTPDSSFSFFRTFGFVCAVMLISSLALISYTKFEMSNWVQVEHEKLRGVSLKMYIQLLKDLKTLWKPLQPEKKEENDQDGFCKDARKLKDFCEKAIELITQRKCIFIDQISQRIKIRKRREDMPKNMLKQWRKKAAAKRSNRLASVTPDEGK